jgi:hypothetical protein
MIEQLFGSKTRVKLLYLFYGNPNRSFYVREITRKIDEQINSVRRELANLLTIGIITSDNTNNRLYYEVNQKFEHYDSLLAMFGHVGTKPKSALKPRAVKRSTIDGVTVPEQTAITGSFAGTGDDLQADIQGMGNVDIAILTGQFTRDESTGVDLLIVGNINQNKLHKYVAELEAKESKEIRYTVFSVEDYRYREQIKDRFVDLLKSAKKQVLIDKRGIFG